MLTLPCQTPGAVGPQLGLVGPMSVHTDWLRQYFRICIFHLSVTASKVFRSGSETHCLARKLSNKQRTNNGTATSCTICVHAYPQTLASPPPPPPHIRTPTLYTHTHTHTHTHASPLSPLTVVLWLCSTASCASNLLHRQTHFVSDVDYG